MSRYEVVYFGEFFYGDKKEGWNVCEARDWNDAWSFYNILKNNNWRVYIKDNEEDLCYEDGEWY